MALFPFIIFLDFNRKENFHIGLIYVLFFYINMGTLVAVIKVVGLDIIYVIPVIFPLVFFIAWINPPAQKPQEKPEVSDLIDD